MRPAPPACFPIIARTQRRRWYPAVSVLHVRTRASGSAGLEPCLILAVYRSSMNPPWPSIIQAIVLVRSRHHPRERSRVRKSASAGLSCIGPLCGSGVRPAHDRKSGEMKSGSEERDRCPNRHLSRRRPRQRSTLSSSMALTLHKRLVGHDRPMAISFPYRRQAPMFRRRSNSRW